MILFITARTWKQPKCPSAEGRIKMWHMYTMEYYSAIKKNKVMLFTSTWVDPEIVIHSKVRREKQIRYDITYIWNLFKNVH